MRLFYENYPFFCVFISLLCGILTTLIHDGKKARALTLAMLAVCAVLNGVVCFSTAARGVSFTYSMGAFPAPWGNELRSGPVEALLATVFCLVMGFSLLGGEADLKEDILPEKQNLYYIMMDLLAASLFALCFTNDMFTGYVFIEINTIAACSIVMAKDSGQTIVATIRYLMMSLVGSGVFLFGVSMLYTITGHLLMPSLFPAVTRLFRTGAYQYPLAVLAGMMCVGLAVKSALFPFHTWLPTAHGSATTASSAVLSGVVLKGYIILLIKVMCRVFTPEEIGSLGVGSVLLVLGACAMIYGSIWAVREPHAKRMIAYSSVAQVGYIYLGLGLCTTAGMAAAIFQIIAHAFTKPLLFVSTGGLIDASGHQKKLYYLRGAGRRCPMAGVGFTVGGLSMVGLPLLAGFVTKLVLGRAALAEGIPSWQMILSLTAIAISSLLNAWYYLPAILQIWKGGEAPAGPGGEAYVHGPYEACLSFRIAVVCMSVVVVLLGCFAQPLMELITRGVALL
ncbi:MAG: sodium:proton antiporter [Oscillospiraceae bacterium]|nr:sodium:proton antiporter [Oscillospiraceae bacterium]